MVIIQKQSRNSKEIIIIIVPSVSRSKNPIKDDTAKESLDSRKILKEIIKKKRTIIKTSRN